MQRVVSLLPATTEIVCALGMGDHLVGRSHECDYPEQVSQLPICSEPKYPFQGTSYEIDQRVKAVLAEGLSIYRVHTETLKSLNPDLILTQDQCEVCAVSLNEVEQCLANLGMEASILSFSPETLEDILADIQTIADKLHVPKQGNQLQRAITQGFEDIKAKTSQRPQVHIEVIEWINPLMTAGNWMPDLIEIAGGCSTLGESGKHSPFIDFEVLKDANPEIIAIIPCGYSIDQTKTELDHLFSLSGWNELKAVQNNQVFLADGHQYFNRPGPRIADSARILAEIIHPDSFPQSHKKTGWIALDVF
ncbi:MAG: cobalamin-binding protein [Balneolaceae bacterium]|nr:cobalamin-binding protein [Balneolaceae bacterium]